MPHEVIEVRLYIPVQTDSQYPTNPRIVLALECDTPWLFTQKDWMNILALGLRSLKPADGEHLQMKASTCLRSYLREMGKQFPDIAALLPH